MSKIVDLFDGKYLLAWKDTNFIFISFPFHTTNIPLEIWENVKHELLTVINAIDLELESNQKGSDEDRWEYNGEYISAWIPICPDCGEYSDIIHVRFSFHTVHIPIDNYWDNWSKDLKSIVEEKDKK